MALRACLVGRWVIAGDRVICSFQRCDGQGWAECGTRDFHKVPVMRKEEHLGRFPKLSEYPKPGSCTLIVEIDKQVIGDEWER